MWFGIGKRATYCAILVSAVVWWLVAAASAEQCNKTADRIFADAALSVARVFVISIDPFDPANKVSYGVGTGFLVDENGTMVTNYHVLLNPRHISVSFGSGQSFNAKFVAGDPILDIAIMRVDMLLDNLRALPFAAADFPPVGSSVFAIGHPLGLGKSISSGIVSSVDVVLPVSSMSWDAPFIQTDAAINPGNSGGPLINGCGQVVGMNTLGAPFAENIGFAIPARTVKSAVAELLSHGKITRPWIGISGGIADSFVLDLARMPAASGFVIETIEPGSAADKAGLRGGYLPLKLGASSYILGGDIITKVNGIEISDLSTTVRIVRSLKAGDKIEVEYFRDGELHTLEAVLPERPLLPEDIRVLYRTVYRQEESQLKP